MLNFTRIVAIAILAVACSASDGDVKVEPRAKDVKMAEAREANADMASGPFAAVPSGQYKLEDTHGYLVFSYSHKGLSNPIVSFTDFDVDLNLNKAEPSKSTLAVNVNIDSIDSRVEKFDNHLKSADMFEVAQFPNASFTSTDIQMLGDGKMNVTGNLTIKDVTKPLTLKAKVNKSMIDSRKNKALIGVSASGKFKRSDWGVGYAVPVVGDEVTLTIEVELQAVQ